MVKKTNKLEMADSFEQAMVTQVLTRLTGQQGPDIAFCTGTADAG